MLTGFDFVSAVRALAPGADLIDVESRVDQLMARWSEPHRKYHTTVHLAEVLAAGEQLRHAGELTRRDLPLFHLAAWFHDAVYSVGDPDANERSSAALAARSLGPLGAADGVVDRVVTLVLDTAGHDLDDTVDDPARLVLHDADLWILAAPVARFDEYCGQVRSEYEHVPAAQYAAGRAAVLRPFLVRPHVYLTSHARRLWEPVARENLARELTRLAG